MASPDPFLEVRTYRIMQSVAYASATFLICEFLSTINVEVTKVWPRPRTVKGWVLKVLFLILRYLPLPVYIHNYYTLDYITTHSVSRKYCIALYAFQSVAMQLMVTCLGAILCLRVYAFSGGNLVVGIVLAALLFAELGFDLSITVMLFPRSVTDDHCRQIKIPRETAYPGYAMIVTQGLIGVVMILIIIKHGIFRHMRWGRTSLVSVLVRDNIITFFAIFGFVGAATILLKFLVYITYHYIISVYSSLGCRLVINMYQVEMRPAEGLVLTTVRLVDDPEQQTEPGFLQPRQDLS